MDSQTCPSCKEALGLNDNFCQNCGASIKQQAPLSKAHIKSTGTYSGKMAKNGPSLFKRILYTLLFIIILGGAAILVWFQIDPDAGKKLKSTVDTAGAVLIVLLFTWIFFKGKKGRRSTDPDYDDGWDDDNNLDDDDD